MPMLNKATEKNRGEIMATGENEITKGFTDAVNKDAIDKMSNEKIDLLLEILKNIK